MGADQSGNRERPMKKIMWSAGRIDAPANSANGKGTSSTRAAKADLRNWASAPEVPGLPIKLVLTILFAIPSLLTAQPGSPNEQSVTQKASFTVAIRATKATIKPSSPISVAVTITNTSDHPIDVQMPGSENPDAFEVRDSKGTAFAPWARAVEINQVFFPVESPDLSPSSTLSASVQSGKSVTFLESLPDDFKLKRPGKYSIVAHRSDGSGGYGTVASNVATVIVVP
jgi:hypothetical protein